MNCRCLRLVLLVSCLVAIPFRAPAPLIYRPGEGWTYETAGGGGKWQRTRAKEQLDVAQAAFGVAGHRIEIQKSTAAIEPERYLGVYRALAGECRIEKGGEGLRMRAEWKLGGEGSIEDGMLIPLGDDRFLVDGGNATSALELPEDIAFFGIDQEGRATNLTRIVFPFSRIT